MSSFKTWVNLGSYTIAELEQGILYPDRSPLLQSLVWRLIYNKEVMTDSKYILNSLKKSKEMHMDKWHEVLVERFPLAVYHLALPSNPLTTAHFTSLPIDQRLDILLALCQWNMDTCEPLVKECRDEENAEKLRVLPFGHDDAGNVYWHFARMFFCFFFLFFLVCVLLLHSYFSLTMIVLFSFFITLTLLFVTSLYITLLIASLLSLSLFYSMSL